MDDEADLRFLLCEQLASAGYVPVAAAGVQDALRLSAGGAGLLALVVDLRLGDGNGLELLAEMRRRGNDSPAIVITGHADLEAAKLAMRLGTVDLLEKPFALRDLVTAIGRCATASDDHESAGALETATGSPEVDLRQLMGPSPAVASLDAEVTRIAATDLTVVLTGETGTGKELVARALHARGRRRDGPFVVLDCGVVPESLIDAEMFGHERGAFTGADRARAGKFERAASGTLLLDEVENLSPQVQAKLLRVLQEREMERVGGAGPVRVDVRVVVATNVPLELLVERGAFRRDLYHRLAEAVLALPPLRSRLEDIPFLARRFLEEARASLGGAPPGDLSADALAVLLAHAWPGNCRELRNIVRRAALRAAGRVVEQDDVASSLGRIGPAGGDGGGGVPATADWTAPAQTLREIVHRAVVSIERRTIADALGSCRGNKSRAARRLGCDWKTLQAKLRAYGLEGDA